MIIGISFGLGAALLISISYIFSRRFTEVKGGRPADLLIAAYLLMGPVSLAIFILGPRELYPPLSDYLLPTVITTLFHLTAQILLYTALTRAPASRISPLLGLKLLFIALITSLLMAESYSTLQILAVLLAVGAALILNFSGGAISLSAWIYVLGACLSYAISDIYIGIVVVHFAHLSPLMRGMLPMAACYILAGGLAFISIPFTGPVRLSQLRSAAPYALFWMSAMVFFFAAVSYLGVMYATILQSGRGLFSVLIGAALGFAGFHLLEEKHGWKVILRRIGAALMMTAAVTLFGLGGL